MARKGKKYTIDQSIKSIDRVKKFMATLPRGTNRVASQAIANWLVGDSQVGLRHPPPYKFVSRARAYGKVSRENPPAPKGYFSWKQFRYVAWKTKGFTENMGSADNRTGASTEAWKVIPDNTSGSYRFRLVNDQPGAYYTMDDYGQARQPRLVGWRKVSEIISKHMQEAIWIAIEAVNTYLLNTKGQKDE